MHHFVTAAAATEHRLSGVDPRLKLLASLALLGLAISSRGGLFPVLLAALCLGTALAIKVRPRLLLARLAQPFFIAGVLLVLKLFTGSGEEIGSCTLFGHAFVAHLDGLHAGLLIAGRIVAAVSVLLLLGFSTPFTELMAALAWLRVPRDLIEVALFAWRSLFVLFDDAQVVYSAQRNRLGYSGWKRSLASFGTLAGALVIKAFDSSQTLTTAMVQRGYDGTLPLCKHRPFRAGEVTCSSLLVVIMGALWLI